MSNHLLASTNDSDAVSFQEFVSAHRLSPLAQYIEKVSVDCGI